MRRPIEVYQAALAKLIKAAFGESITFCEIPANRDRDADLLVQEALDELKQLRADLARVTSERDEWSARAHRDHDLSQRLFAERDALAARVEALKEQVMRTAPRDPDAERFDFETLQAQLSAAQAEAVQERGCYQTASALLASACAERDAAQAACAEYRAGWEHETGCQICADDGCAECPSCKAPALLNGDTSRHGADLLAEKFRVESACIALAKENADLLAELERLKRYEHGIDIANDTNQRLIATNASLLADLKLALNWIADAHEGIHINPPNAHCATCGLLAALSRHTQGGGA